MRVQDIADLITVRNFLSSSIDNLNIKLSREELKNVQARITFLDKTIVEQSLKLDLSRMSTDAIVRQWQSTEPVETVAERVQKAIKINNDGSVTVEAPAEEK